MSSGDIPFGDSGPKAYNPGVTVSAARSTAEAQIMAMPGVNGLGQGRDKLGNPAWIAYVDHSGIAASLPKMVAGRAVIIEVTGGIDAQPR